MDPNRANILRAYVATSSGSCGSRRVFVPSSVVCNFVGISFGEFVFECFGGWSVHVTYDCAVSDDETVVCVRILEAETVV